MDEPGKRKSGGTRKKEANLKRIAEQKVVASIPKVTTFFAKKQSDALSHVEVNYVPDLFIDVVNDELAQTVEEFSGDPADWVRHNNELIEFITTTQLKRDVNATDFSRSETRDNAGTLRRASKEFFFRKLINGENRERDWLIYSAKSGSVYCKPCFFFGKTKSSLASEGGFCNWKVAHKAISEHEQSAEHNHAISIFVNRSECSRRIDCDFVKQFQSEKEYWRCVLRRVVSVIKFLSSR